MSQKTKSSLNNHEKAILNLYVKEKTKVFRRKELFTKLRRVGSIEHDYELTRTLNLLIKKEILTKRREGYKEVYYELIDFENRNQILLKIRDQKLLENFEYNDITNLPTNLPWSLGFYGFNHALFPADSYAELVKLVEKSNSGIKNLIDYIEETYNKQIKEKWETLLKSDMPEIHQWILWFIYTQQYLTKDLGIHSGYRKCVCIIAKWLFNSDKSKRELFDEHFHYLAEYSSIISIIENTLWFHNKPKMINFVSPGVSGDMDFLLELYMKSFSKFYKYKPPSKYFDENLELKDAYKLPFGKSTIVEEVNDDFKSENELLKQLEKSINVDKNEDYNFDWTGCMINRITGIVNSKNYALLKEPEINKESLLRTFDGDKKYLGKKIVDQILDVTLNEKLPESIRKDIPNIELVEKHLRESEKDSDKMLLVISWFNARWLEFRHLKRQCGCLFFFKILADLEIANESQKEGIIEIKKEIKNYPEYLKILGKKDAFIDMIFTLCLG